MSGWLIYADLISAGLGLIGTVALGVPAIKAIRAKRYYERALQMRSERTKQGRGQVQMKALTKKVEALQLAGARDALVWNLAGYALLFLSFIFLAMASIERAG